MLWYVNQETDVTAMLKQNGDDVRTRYRTRIALGTWTKYVVRKERTCDRGMVIWRDQRKKTSCEFVKQKNGTHTSGEG